MAGSTVVLLHAFPLDARMWEAQRRVLTEAGCRVVAPDLPGEPPVRGFEAWARRVLGSLDGDLVPVGCSMGGYLGFELWRQAPERIRALALLDTRATPDTREQRTAREESIRVLRESRKEVFWKDLAPRLFSARADPAVVERARGQALSQPTTTLVTVQETIRDRPDSRSTLAGIDVPVLALVGEEDVLTPPADAEAMVAALPTARLARIGGAGHLSPLERPEEVNDALLGFLREAVP